MKKYAVFLTLFLLIFSNIFADEKKDIFENIFFPWQFYDYLNGNKYRSNDLMVLNQVEIIPMNFNFKYIKMPELSETTIQPIGPVTAFLSTIHFLASMDKLFNDWREYLIHNPPNELKNTGLLLNEWEQGWKKERELDNEKLRDHSYYGRIDK